MTSYSELYGDPPFDDLSLFRLHPDVYAIQDSSAEPCSHCAAPRGLLLYDVFKLYDPGSDMLVARIKVCEDCESIFVEYQPGYLQLISVSNISQMDE